MKLYQDLDELPIFNWFKIHETGDLNYLVVSGKNGYKKKLQEHWRKLYDMYIEAFGFSSEFLKILNKEKQIALMMIEKAETGNAVLQTHIELKQYDLTKMKDGMTKANLYQIKAHMDKHFGFHFDAKKVSVMEFFNNIKLIENESKRK